MKLFVRLFIGALILCLPGCHSHDHDHAATDHDHDHLAEEVPSRAVTLWSSDHELFMEYPLPVVGREIQLITHLTALEGWLPRTRGAVTFRFIHQEGDTFSHTASKPSRDGIYLPKLSFAKAGTWRLDLHVDDDLLTVPDMVVYQTADAIPAQPEEADTIGFLKEQQWKIPFATQPVRHAAIRPTLTVFANLRAASDRKTILKAPVSGRLHLENPLAPGGRVAAQTRVAGLLPSPNDLAEPTNVTAGLEKARAEFELATQEHERIQSLVAKGVLPEYRSRHTAATLKQKQADVEAAKQRVLQLESRTGETSGNMIWLTAPFSGKVTAVHAAPGAFLEQGESIAEITSVEAVWLEVWLPESQLRNVGEITALGFDWQGDFRFSELTTGDVRPISTGAALDPQRRVLPLLFEIKNPDGGLIPGTTVLAELYLGQGDPILAIPRQALVFEDGFQTAYVQTGGESFERRLLQLGASNLEMVAVHAGLNEGERVVTEGAYLVRLASMSGDEAGHGHAH